MFYVVSNAVEPASPANASQFGNSDYYGVHGGCVITYSGADMTFDVSDGVVVVDGLAVHVAAQTNVTGLSSDGTFPTWALIVLDNAGTASVVLGTPAADPAVPPMTQGFTPLAFLLIEAGQTIANNIAVVTDKRVPIREATFVLANDFDFQANASLTDVPGFSFYLEDTNVYEVHMWASCVVGATPGVKLDFTLPTAATRTGSAAGTGLTEAAASAIAPPFVVHPAGALTVLHLYATVTGGGTDGIVKLQACQDVNDASTSIFYAESMFTVRRVG